MTSVKCYGGPSHGRVMRLEDGQCRIEVVDWRGPPRHPFGYFEEHPPAVPDPYKTHTYYIRWYAERPPRSTTIYRELRVAVFEGADLFPKERYDLDGDLRQAPWRITRKASILYEFDEWWRQTVLEFTGRLTDESGRMLPLGYG